MSQADKNKEERRTFRAVVIISASLLHRCTISIYSDASQRQHTGVFAASAWIEGVVMSSRRALVWCVGVLFAVLTVGFTCVTPHAVTSALGVATLGGLMFLWRNSQGRTVFSLLNQYVTIGIVAWLGKRQKQKLHEDTLDVGRVQEETLIKRLRGNAGTVYGRRYEFGSVQDAEEFRRRVPLSSCERYAELLELTTAGVENVLVMEEPVVLATTSATSGRSNLLLSTKDSRSELFFQGVAVCAHVKRQTFPNPHSLQRTLWLLPPHSKHQSVVGIPTRHTQSTLSFSNHLLHLCTTPPPALMVQSQRDLLYLHLLFALKDRNVSIVESSVCSTMFYAFRVLQEHWTDLADDVEAGRVSERLVLDRRLRADLERWMTPDPVRAAELRAELSEGFQGVACRLWPRLHLLVAVDSGPEQIYGELLRQFYCEGLPLYSPLYSTPEGLIGVNLWPLREARHYLLCPRSMFCEFLPEEKVEMEQSPTLLMDQVEEGQSYELIITSAAGLYRYRTGDIVKVVEFHNQCPVVELLYRRSEMLSVRGEKVSEALFLSALKKAVAQWPGARLLDYCCAESSILEDLSGGAQPHYLVFLELKGVRNLTEEQRYKLDCCLQRDSAIYRSFRIKGSIGPMRVQLVSEGVIQEMRSRMMCFWNISPNEFKIHRVIRHKEHADFLLVKTIS